MKATDKTSKNNIAGKIFFISRNEFVFFRMFFLSPEIDSFFQKSATILYARWAEKTHVFLVKRGLNLMRALI